MTLLERLKVGFSAEPGKSSPPVPGLYHYKKEAPGEQVRLHLRIDADGRGLLLVNASRVYHLNPSAAAIAYYSLEEVPEAQALKELQKKYRASRDQLSHDYAQTVRQLETLIHPDGSCPIHDLELETTLPFSARPSAPYRMDLALTYRCNNDCAHCYNARPRTGSELSTRDWLRVIDRCWELRIPHIVFTGGEPTLRDDLPELIAHAEGNGQITGINTNGRRLRDPNYVQRLVEAGLDHVQITLESQAAAVHDSMVRCRGAWEQTVAGIRNVLATRLYVMTNTTLLQPNHGGLEGTLDFLAGLGVPTVGLNALIYSGRGASRKDGLPEKDLPPLLDLARRKLDQTGQRLIWYTPTEYCHFDPVQMDLGVKGCTAALYNMCVEPDGSVIPCQSYYRALGNLLTDPWESIWNHDLSIALRERRDLPGKCLSCAFLIECGGGCPLARLAHV
ncbi:MAG TPA: radical SAM protein [Anaerolineaceae bacterium]|nr:radical SAM protein [Anaerolineaceae bacterium]